MLSTPNQFKNRLLLIVLITSAGLSAQAGTVELWRDATITHEAILLGDVCSLVGFEPDAENRFLALRVASAPAIGESDVVSMAAIRKVLAGSGINLAMTVFKGATNCEVNRIARTLPEKKSPTTASRHESPRSTLSSRTLRQVIEADLNEDAARLGGWVQVVYERSLGSMLDMREGEYEFEIQRTNDKRLGTISLHVTVYADSKQVQDLTITASVTFVKPTVVAVRPINMNSTVTKRDVDVVNMNFKRFEQAGADSSQAVVGQRAKRFIGVGQVIHERYLEPLPLVKRGQIVQVYSRSGGVVVESVGRVMKAGAYGDVVELQTADRAKRRFTAIVAGPGLVSVGPLNKRTHTSTTRLALGGEE